MRMTNNKFTELILCAHKQQKAKQPKWKWKRKPEELGEGDAQQAPKTIMAQI